MTRAVVLLYTLNQKEVSYEHSSGVAKELQDAKRLNIMEGFFCYTLLILLCATVY